MSKKRGKKLHILLFTIIVLVFIGIIVPKYLLPVDASKIKIPSWINQEIIDQDGHSRTGAGTDKITGIVIHYVANPGSSAKNNRDYFNSAQSRVSSHFVVGLEGEVIQCVPLDEQSSASNHRNVDTISIEVCHPDESGEFTIPSYNATVKLCVWLCKEFRLDENDVIRHYDITGKMCPKYYVEHEDSWLKFKGYIKERL